MATKGAFPIKVDSNLHGFARVLKSAACEWLLLFLLLLDAAFSYFLTKFAQYCELQLPCILCSRLDHILGKENPEFYINLLCKNHKSEISSLVSCHNHGKLVDVHGMCEECLLSFAKNESSEETYKILVGKLGSECIQKPLVNLDSGSGSSLTTKFCSCCSKPWRSRPNVQKFVRSKLPSTPISNPEISLPNSQEGLKNRRDRFSVSTKPLIIGSTDFDSLSHVGYTEVKISSDSDSDFPFSDDEELITVPQTRKKDEFLLRSGSNFTPKNQYDFVLPPVQRQKSTPVTSNLMFPYLEPEKGETTTPRFLVSDGDLRQKGIGELNWQQLIKKTSPVTPELVMLDDIPLSSSAPKVSPAVSADEGDRVSLSKNLDVSGYSDFISHKTASPFENMQLSARLSKENCIETKVNGDKGHSSAMNNWESIDLHSTSTVSSVKKDVAFVPNSSYVIDARELTPVPVKGVKASCLLSEEIDIRACNGIESGEELSVSKVSDPQTDSSSSNSSSSIGATELTPVTIKDVKATCLLSEEIGVRACSSIGSIGSGEESSVSKVSDPRTDSFSSNSSYAIGAKELTPVTIKDVKATCLLSEEIGVRECSGIGSGEESSVSKVSDSFSSNSSYAIGATEPTPVTVKGVKASRLLSEEIGVRECSGIGSGEELSVSKVSDSQTDSSSSNMYPSMNGHSDEPQKTESSSSNESLMPPKSPSMERSQSLESLEESVSVSEIEGESLVDKLRRQVDYDKKCIKNLHKELEEERNAQSIERSQSLEESVSEIEGESLVNKLRRQADFDKKCIRNLHKELEEERNAPRIERSQSLEFVEESVSEIEGQSLVDKLRRQAEFDKKCIKNLHKELEEERNAEFVEESVSEIEGESLVDKLRRQVDYDKKCIKNLHKELEEERNAPNIERSQSLEFLEESVSEIEGESLVDKLRRQVDYDKKCINNLHKELEEERNAAAIAANQAMAMITKLQEDKAALNMEALQYLRMMEEQAEYDVDALEKANDMIAEKEKEIQELEAELDFFRIKYPEDFPEMNEDVSSTEDAQGSESIENERS
ncbi:hypothetical protein SOVF_043980 [Spinacia oleracea]|nr:hypothetical protein SOVF_043980 [Spinacia oleracea]